jgi:hypothetical protein
MTVALRPWPPSDAERAANPFLVLVRWPFDAGVNGGHDIGQVLAAMIDFEKYLFDAMAAGGWGVGAAVVTHDGVREWRVFAPTAERFQAGFNEALSGWPPLPISLELFSDPNWEAYREIASGIPEPL